MLTPLQSTTSTRIQTSAGDTNDVLCENGTCAHAGHDGTMTLHLSSSHLRLPGACQPIPYLAAGGHILGLHLFDEAKLIHGRAVLNAQDLGVSSALPEELSTCSLLYGWRI